ncbi:MAG: AAA family ATPase, partial [Muribaculaceae bacterium]|nr:AAA family ATPase [Muribaculaceae bacterium]
MNGEEALEPLEAARRIVDHTGVNLFLTGKAGTGKTTFLRRLVAESPKRIVILAPTGVAAINAGGVTIHSFFQLDFAPYIPGTRLSSDGVNRFSKKKINIIRTLDLLVIDEISMVRPDVLDAVDVVMRRYRNPLKPFGGVQLLLIGDLRQLAPVAQEQEWNLLKEHYASPYFFESHALREAGFLMVELTKVFRQSDERFINILNKIRDNRADDAVLEELNRRADPSLMPAAGSDKGYIRLTTHNHRADRINSRRMEALPGKEMIFTAEVKGKFPESSFPADMNLHLKEGAQVMFIKNDPSGMRNYYNGLIGELVKLSRNEVIVRPRVSADGDFPATDIHVSATVWENTSYELQENGELKETVEGSFTQIPLRPAWAITIHKSQGLTFDHAIVDAAASFAPGQTYVALSRCRSLEGLVLDGALPRRAIMTDQAVNSFIESQPRLATDSSQISRFEDSYYCSQMLELFNFRVFDNAFDSYYRATASALPALFPSFMSRIDEAHAMVQRDLMEVAYKMQQFLQARLPYRSDEEVKASIEKKVKGGADYFYTRLKRLKELVILTPLQLDNKAARKRLKNALDQLVDVLDRMMAPLLLFSTEEFSPRAYLNAKAKEVLRMSASAGDAKSKDAKGGKSAKSVKTPVTNRRAYPATISGIDSDVKHPALYDMLRDWRAAEADGTPLYLILSNKALMGIANTLPTTKKEL